MSIALRRLRTLLEQPRRTTVHKYYLYTCRCEDAERLRSSYSLFHNRKTGLHDRNREVASKPSSYRLLAGTNEFAEDLTGQRQPLNAWNWTSETKVCTHVRVKSFNILDRKDIRQVFFGVKPSTLNPCPKTAALSEHKPYEVPSYVSWTGLKRRVTCV